ncbi:hypothetical protein FACS1894151_09720 [Spirochaetia bacterium]|nr:hypothetical protein FACS1894151_09720 [Spirochaetia bacterium]
MLELTDEMLRRDFLDYLNNSIGNIAVIDESATLSITNIILLRKGVDLANYIDYFKNLAKHMEKNILVRPDNREPCLMQNGQFVFTLVGSKESGDHNFSSLLLCLYFTKQENIFHIYDFGFRQ